MTELVHIIDENDASFIVLKEKLQDFLEEARKSGADTEYYYIDKEFCLYGDNYYEQI